LAVKNSWTTEEKRVVLSDLGSFIKSGVVPGKDPCEECIKKNAGVLKNRPWKKIKYFVYNEILRRNRKVQNK